MAFSQACDAAFVVFLVSWIVTRQVGLFLVIKSAAVEAPKYIAFKWDPANGHYLTKGMYYGFIILLSILLVLCTVWFYMAIMVAVRVVRGQGAEDTRSDSEDTDDDAISLEDEDDGVIPNGHTNGVNGHANGHANGNGVTNGITNGNGVNGVNGHSSAVNGHANGLKNRKH
jgi:acyl-CoA-dependent ceramide synthase